MRGINSAKLCEGIMTGVFKTQQRELFLNYSVATVPDKAVVVSRIEDEFNYRDINDIMNHKVNYLRVPPLATPSLLLSLSSIKSPTKIPL
jgi:hypothetical protein